MRNDDILWQADEGRQSASALLSFARYLEESEGYSLSDLEQRIDYRKLHRYSVDDIGRFWRHIWQYFQVRGSLGVETHVPGLRFQDSEWFPDSKLNFAVNLLTRRDSAPALISVREDGHTTEISYGELYQLVARCARALEASGVGSGDRVCACLPNSYEAIVLILACSAIGAVFASASPDFGVPALSDRFGQIQPKLMVSVEAYLYAGKRVDMSAKLAEVRANIPSLERCVIVPYVERDGAGLKGYELWQDWLAPEGCSIDFAPLPFESPLYILFSSGTTGKPKCIVHRAGGVLLKHLCELNLHCELRRDSCLLYFTTCGWMMWNWMVSALALGARLVLYDGSPLHPKPERLFDLVEQHGVTHLGAGARYYAELVQRKLRPKLSHRLEQLEAMFSTGSVLAPELYDYIYQNIKSDIHLASISGGTDLVGLLLGGNSLLPVKRGQLQCAVLGMDCAIYDEHGKSVYEQEGELVCRQSFPTVPLSFWGDDTGKLFHEAYFAKFSRVWAHGDYASRHSSESYTILGRSDTTLNPSGVRIGSAEIYRQLVGIEQIFECAAVGWRQGGDEQIVLFVVLTQGLQLDEQLQQSIKNKLRSAASPRHVPAYIIQAPDLPRTMSGKIAEKAIGNSISGKQSDNENALANPESLEFFRNLTIPAQQ